MTSIPCEDTLDDPILCDILSIIRSSKSHKIVNEKGTDLCSNLHFTFTTVLGGRVLPITVHREGDKIIYLATIKPVDHPNDPNFKEFKNFILRPDLLFHAGETILKSHDEREQSIAVARYDDDAVNYFAENIKLRFVDTLVNLRHFITQIPLAFLAS